MSDIDRAVRIVRTHIRPSADRLLQAYFLFQIKLQLAAAEDWIGLIGQFGDKEPLPDPDGNDAANTPVTPEAVKIELAAMQTFVDFMDASGFKDTLIKIAVNPTQNVG